MPNSSSDILDVVFVTYENALSTSIALPMELLNAAESMARSKRFKVNTSVKTPPKLRFRIATSDGSAKNSRASLDTAPSVSIEDIHSADIIFLPALWRNPFPVVKKNETICSWLSQMFSRETTLIAGVGTGCCFMAEAGLLDHRVATTHWFFFEQFQQHYPLVKLQRNYFITQSDRLYCTGSVNTLADLTVHFIEQYYGSVISREVERHFFHDIRQSYQKLALLDDRGQLHHDEAVLESQTYIAQNPSADINFDALAESAGMSRRNFDRRFKAAVGVTPLNYLQKSRMSSAKELLKNTNLSIAEVMFEVGYLDSAHFSKLFKKQHGATPAQYRTTVRAKLFSVE